MVSFKKHLDLYFNPGRADDWSLSSFKIHYRQYNGPDIIDLTTTAHEEWFSRLDKIVRKAPPFSNYSRRSTKVARTLRHSYLSSQVSLVLAKLVLLNHKKKKTFNKRKSNERDLSLWKQDGSLSAASGKCHLGLCAVPCVVFLNERLRVSRIVLLSVFFFFFFI